VNINLSLGVDTDGDGIPDDWEWMVIANSGGRVTSLSQVGPGHDLDGDGIPDDKEFLLGTFAFLPDDQLRMGSLTRVGNGRLSFSFTPIDGVVYWVEFSAGLESPTWSICPVSLTQAGPLTAGTFKGGTQAMTVYFDPSNPTRFWRLKHQ
jgi:hypothetical protein